MAFALSFAGVRLALMKFHDRRRQLRFSAELAKYPEVCQEFLGLTLLIDLRACRKEQLLLIRLEMISEWFQSEGHRIRDSWRGRQKKFTQTALAAFVEAFGLESAINVVVSAVALLSFVYQYLVGYVDGGGSKAYSSGSLDFRDTYVSIVLFRGAYVWIKFRQPATPGSSRKRKFCATVQGVQFGDEADLQGVYARPVRDRSGSITHYKYEPRFKPPREAMGCGITQQFNCLSLGRYDSLGEAKIVRQIAAFYYEKAEGRVALGDGSYFSIPLMKEQEKCLTGMDKAKRVTSKAKEVYEDFLKQKQFMKQLRRASETGAHSGHGSDEGSDSSSSTPAVTCSFLASSRSANEHSESPIVAPLVQVTPSHEGNGREQLGVSVPGGLTYESIPAIDQFSGVFADNCSGVQYNVPDTVNGDLATDDYGKTAGHHDDFLMSISDVEYLDVILNPERPDIRPQQLSCIINQMHTIGTTEILRNPTPEMEGATQGFELIEPQLSPNPNFLKGLEDLIGSVPGKIVTSESVLLKQRDPVFEQVNSLQQMVSHQKKLLEDSAVRNVDLQHQLCEFEVKNSELQREKSELQQENDCLRAMIRQLARTQAATWSGILSDFQQN